MNICVFCGSSTGANTRYGEAARELGHLIATEKHSLVYGGGNIGLMGILADAVIEKGGQVTGVIPGFLKEREVGHGGLSELIIVHSMHERKRKMADLSDAFIALPGGWGTLEELAEILTWRQLGLIQQPIGIVNIHNFFDPVLDQMQKMVEEGFLKKENFDLIKVGSTPAELLSLIIP